MNKSKPPVMYGEKNPSWKGGRRISTQGYVLIRVGGTEVREHRHVMEMYLGRKLSEKETVHHINGDKQDNRVENLELWASVHPKGQRVSDLIEYAHEILDRYSALV